MTPSIKQAAEENNRNHPSSADYYYSDHDNEYSFIAGDAHGYARAVKMLREEAYKLNCHDERRFHSEAIAHWLEEQEKSK